VHFVLITSEINYYFHHHLPSFSILSKGVGRKFSRKGKATEKKPKISKNTEKLHYLASSKGAQRKKDRKIAKKAEK